MPLTKMEAENFTVFEKMTIPFCKGLNILIGENGMGKTHIMKVAYAACQASKHDVSFSQKMDSCRGKREERKEDGRQYRYEDMDLCQYFGQKKSKDHAAFLSSSSSFC